MNHYHNNPAYMAALKATADLFWWCNFGDMNAEMIREIVAEAESEIASIKRILLREQPDPAPQRSSAALDEATLDKIQVRLGDFDDGDVRAEVAELRDIGYQLLASLRGTSNQQVNQ